MYRFKSLLGPLKKQTTRSSSSKQTHEWNAFLSRLFLMYHHHSAEQLSLWQLTLSALFSFFIFLDKKMYKSPEPANPVIPIPSNRPSTIHKVENPRFNLRNYKYLSKSRTVKRFQRSEIGHMDWSIPHDCTIPIKYLQKFQWYHDILSQGVGKQMRKMKS